jgi:hypothetical protein
MSLIVVDVESDGVIPHKYSMVCFGAVIVEPSLSKTFYGKTKPISDLWIPEALAISGFTRAAHEQFDEPLIVMKEFAEWIQKNSVGKPVFISDNPAFDWQWINYYFHEFVGKNPFGFSARRIGDLYCGMKMDSGLNSQWKQLYRKTTHDHLTPNNEHYLKVRKPEDETRHRLFSRYYVNDTLLVKEKWCYAGHNNVQDGAENFNKVIYAASPDGEMFADNYTNWKWKSSLFLKTTDIRLKLKITSVRAERLMQISDEDCINEGIETWGGKETGYFRDYDKQAKSDIPMSARGSYMSLWDSINGNGSFQKNPYVWVLNFKIIQ